MCAARLLPCALLHVARVRDATQEDAGSQSNQTRYSTSKRHLAFTRLH